MVSGISGLNPWQLPPAQLQAQLQAAQVQQKQLQQPQSGTETQQAQKQQQGGLAAALQALQGAGGPTPGSGGEPPHIAAIKAVFPDFTAQGSYEADIAWFNAKLAELQKAQTEQEQAMLAAAQGLSLEAPGQPAGGVAPTGGAKQQTVATNAFAFPGATINRLG